MRTRILPILITVLIAGLALTSLQNALAAPDSEVNTGITIDEGAPNEIITDTHLKITDPVSETTPVTYTILTDPQEGDLTVTQGGTFTQTFIDNDNLIYSHSGSEEATDSFQFNVRNDTDIFYTGTFTITVNPVNDTPVLTLSGTSTEDEILTASLTDGDGITDTVAYQWQRSEDGDEPWADINGATNDTYTLDDPDVDHYIRVTATYTDSQGTTEEPASDPTGPIVNINDDPSLAIIGAPTENEILTANLDDDDDYVPGAVNYQWQRSETGSAPWLEIDGATSSTYTLDDIDVGDHIRVTATYTDDHGTAEEAASTSIGPVANVNDIPTFTLIGTQTEDETLSTSLTDDDDYDSGSVTYQWQRSETGSDPWTDINDETSSTYTLGDDDAGNFVRVTATYSDTHGTLEEPIATSGPIANINDEPVLTILGTQTEDQTLTAVLTDDDGLESATVSYQWQRSATGGSPWTPIGGATSSTYTLDDLDAYNFVRVRATYTDDQGTPESPIAATDEIANVNDTPTAANDSFTVAEGQSKSINVLVNDNDVDQFDILSASIETAPGHASPYSLSTNGLLQYTHDGSETTSDTLEYKVCDNGSPVKCATAFVNITIEPVDDPPTAVPDTYNLLEGATVTGNVKTNDFDSENHSFVVITPVISPPSHGVLSNFNSSGAFTYVHNGSENFNDNFVYRVCETPSSPLARCSQTTVTLVITPVNDAPVTSPDTFTVPRSETLDTQAEPGQTTVLANDTDPEGNTLTVNTTPVTPPIYAASFTLNANGSFIYVHNDTSNNPDSFSYQVCDNGSPSKCSTETVTINIGPRPTSFIYLPTILNNYSPDEPNNSPCTAYPISLNSQNNFTPNDIEDWYRITLPSPRNLSVELSNFLLQGDLIVYRSADCVIDGSDEVKNNGTSQSTKTVDWGIAPAGTYYIRVYTANPNPNAQPYKLTVDAP